MTNELRFDGRVAIVTGAGGGLGRSHALLLGARGAKVVVNDLGGAMDGSGKSASAADKVVEEIKAAGGEAVASYDSVENGDAIVKTAMDAFGRIDIIVNNAGILRDKSFHKMTDEDWDLVYRVHVLGSYKVTHAAWPILREQGFGRIVMTASAAGIYGNFGQANYSMAKLGLAGFANTLAVEGRTKNIYVNTIAPLAGSRLTETVMPKELVDALLPEYVSPLVAYLCHEDSNETGGIFEVGGGFYGKLRWERAAGMMKRVGRTITPEQVAESWDRITGFDETIHPTDVMQSMQPIVDNVQAGPSKGGNDLIDVDAALGFEFPELHTEYDERDLALYALGVGAAADPGGGELPFVYELHQDGFKALPTFAVVPAVSAFLDAAKDGMQAPGLNYGLDRILHGEQHTELLRPLPRKAKLTHRAKVKEILDKGKNAIVNIEMKTSDESGELLAINNLIMVVRGAGGWGGDRGETPPVPMPDRDPDAVVTEQTQANQAILYRLSGDWNPLHVDPGFAQAFGFDRPILHGLCTLGYAGRHVVNAMSNGDPRYVKRIGVRMAGSVFPGESLETRMWKDGSRVYFRTVVKDRDEVALENGVIELFDELPKPKAKAAEKAAPAADAPETPVEIVPGSEDVFYAIGRYIRENPKLHEKIATVFRFELSAPNTAWTIDLKNADGGVARGKPMEADTVLTLSDTDFLRMCAGELDSMQMFMDGKLKISGNVMAAQKLEFLKSLNPDWVYEAAENRAAKQQSAAPSAAVAPEEAYEPTSWDVFIAIRDHVKRNPDLVGKIGTVFKFELSAPNSAWTLDLKNGEGAVTEGGDGTADTTLALSETDFMGMTDGSLNPQKLFMEGRLRISGNIMASQKLDFLQKIDPEEAKAAVIAARQAGEAPGAAPVEEAEEAPAGSRVEELLAMIDGKLAENGGIGEEVGAKIQFVVTEPDGAFFSDFTAKPGKTGSGTIEAADATLTAEEGDLFALLQGSASARELFQHGKLRVDGDMSAAKRLWFFR